MKKHSKRYMLIFKTIYGVENTSPYIKGEYLEKTSYSEEEFDDISDINNLISEYTELYKDEVPPVYINEYYVNKHSGVQKRYLVDVGYTSDKNDKPKDWKKMPAYWDFSDGKKWWAYIVLDFEICRIIKFGGDSQIVFCDNRKTGYYWLDRHYKRINLKTDLRKRDLYFCGDDEIPKDYKWDVGEYEGWLQYRWGDGKNALTYIEPPKKPKNIKTETEEASEEDLAKYVSNYEPMHTTDDYEVTFDDDTIDYIRETQIEEEFNKKYNKEFIEKHIYGNFY